MPFLLHHHARRQFYFEAASAALVAVAVNVIVIAVIVIQACQELVVVCVLAIIYIILDGMRMPEEGVHANAIAAASDAVMNNNTEKRFSLCTRKNGTTTEKD